MSVCMWVCVCVCMCVLVARITECLRGCIVRYIQPVLFRELHHTRNLYYYYILYCIIVSFINRKQHFSHNLCRPAMWFKLVNLFYCKVCQSVTQLYINVDLLLLLIVWLKHIMLKVGSVGGASDWHGSDKGVFSHSQLAAQTLLWSPYSPCVKSHASTAVRMLKITNSETLALFGHRKILDTGRKGSAALVAAYSLTQVRSPESSMKDYWSIINKTMF